MATAEVRVDDPGALVKIGTVVWLGSELMFFSGLFAAYYFLRATAVEWPPPGVELEPVRTALFTGVLIASSATMHRAVVCAEEGDDAGSRRWTAVTAALGATFLANQVAEYAGLAFTPTDHAYGSLFFLMTGFHGLHVLGGLVLMGVALAVASGPTARAPLPTTLIVTEYYWHFVDVVWLAMFASLYLIR
jgi:cytochrome c oxidase subunit 3